MFSCFALPDSFLTVARTMSHVGMFCALGHIFSGTEGAVRPFFGWNAKEGHEDPSRACIYLVPVELTAQTHWDAHSGGFY
jgi:hypothetical protein